MIRNFCNRSMRKLQVMSLQFLGLDVSALVRGAND